MTTRVCPYTFCAALALLASSIGRAQVPVFDTPVYAQRDGRDVVLLWDAATGADGYNIYRYEDVPIPPPPQVPLATVTALTYRDVGTVDAPPYKYYYLVSAFNTNGETPAPNLAFKLNIVLHWVSGKANFNFVSLPMLFIPRGRGVQAMGSDLCDVHGISGPYISAVVKMNYSNCLFKTNSNCSQLPAADFPLEPGVGYVILPKVDGITLDIVGSHDPDYHPGGPKSIPLTPSQPCDCRMFNEVSVPYHSKAKTAEDICQELGAAAPEMVGHFIPAIQNEYTHVCGTQYHNFSLVPGEALTLWTHATQWQPDVYQ